MKKEDLRPVKYKVYESLDDYFERKYSEGLENPNTNEEMKFEMFEGYFHQWVTNRDAVSETTYGLIEAKEGKMISVRATDIEFSDREGRTKERSKGL